MLPIDEDIMESVASGIERAAAQPEAFARRYLVPAEY